MSALLRRAAFVSTGATLVLLGTSDSAEAHVCLEYPVSRAGEECTFRTPQKIGPCGIAGRSEHVTVFRPGESITVELNETINHPSHYRIAFNPDGDEFPDPTSIDDRYGHPFILLDGIEDTPEARQWVEITLPEVECDNCTLQLIQVMYDKLANGFGGASGGPDDNDDLYYACADLVLEGAPVSADVGTGTYEELAEAGGRGSPLPILPSLAAGLLALVGIRRIRLQE